MSTLDPSHSNPQFIDSETGLPLTPFEVDQIRHAKVNEQNERREIHRIRKSNQRKGYDAPEIGAVYHVQLDGSVTRRTRGAVRRSDGTVIPGVRFERNKRVEITVVDDESAIAAKALNADAPVVTVLGMEYILDDDALHVFESAMTEVDAEELRRANVAQEEELKVTRAEADRLRRENAELRAARMNAPESTDGRPTRLPAANSAKAAFAAKSAKAGETGPAPRDAAADFGTPAPETK